MLIFLENVNPHTSALRHTLCEAVAFEGVGAHSGERVSVRISPLHEPLGVLLNGEPAREARVISSSFSTTIALPSGARLQTTEHLLAALWCAGVDDARVEVRALGGGEGGRVTLELPILDGSAAEWCAPLRARPTRPHDHGARRAWRALPALTLRQDRCALTLSPEPLAGATLPLTASLSFSVRDERGALGLLGEGGGGEGARGEGAEAQRVEVRTPMELMGLVVPARTFGFESQAPRLRALGLIRGVSLHNTLPLSDHGAPRLPLRHPNELAGHKLLDLIGDLALTGERWRGHIEVERGSHALNALLLERLRGG
jgi:UDP-3-O-[3-hydroxymyristoyl] N-acetylglucosamine deacetylase